MAESCKTPCKRARISADERDREGTRTETDSPTTNEENCERIIPCDIRRWSEKEVHALSIKTCYMDYVSPHELLETFSVEHSKERKTKEHFLWKNIDTIEYFLKHFCHFQNYLDGDFNAIQRNPTINALRKRYLYGSKHFLDEEFAQNTQEELEFWLNRFEVNGMKFGDTLYKMIVKRDLCEENEDPLCGYDFQFLFESFAAMFGFNSTWSEPCIHQSKLQLSRGKIYGKPDILFCWDIRPDVDGRFMDHLNVVAVCEISFTALKMTQEQYQGIIAGKHSTTTQPVLFITKPYDYMLKKDREDLIRPLLILGVKQELRLR